MSEFNENPFKKDTQVSIFSNATEAEYWQINNCHQCKKYENESQTEEQAKCKLLFDKVSNELKQDAVFKSKMALAVSNVVEECLTERRS